MKKNILIFGAILGVILCGNMVYMVRMCYTNANFKSNAVVGYAIMIIIFSMIFFGVRNYRNNELDGIITFGRAFKTGVLIALAGSTIYVVVWLFYYYLFVPDYLEKYIPHVLKETAGSNAADLPAKTKQMAALKENYKNPLFVILITYVEVFPVGLIVALISALILKRKNPAAQINS